MSKTASPSTDQENTMKTDPKTAKQIRFWMKQGMTREAAIALIARTPSYAQIHRPVPTRENS